MKRVPYEVMVNEFERVSVSYTHLDVYKRQQYASVCMRCY